MTQKLAKKLKKEGSFVIPQHLPHVIGLSAEVLSQMNAFLGKPGKITDVHRMGFCKVHNYYWPITALQPVYVPQMETKLAPRRSQEFLLFGISFADLKMRLLKGKRVIAH